MFNIKREGNEMRELDYKSNKCLGCGICVDVCPTDSLSLGPIVSIARGLMDVDRVSINSSTCVLCGLCSVACPFDVLSMKINGEPINDSKLYPSWDIESSVDDDLCVYCGRCKDVCPSDAIIFKRNLPSRQDLVYGEINIDDEKCIYCAFCEELCPAEAIVISDAPEARDDKLGKTIDVDLSKCVFCGVCKRVCPESAIMEVCSTCMMQDQIKVPKITGNTFIAQDQCVNCSWCCEICPVDAITVTKPFEGNLELVETDEKQCENTSCHACLDVCPCNAIEIIDDKAMANLDFCNLCGACVDACPQDIRVLSRTSMNLSNVTSESWKDVLNSSLIRK